MLASWNAYVNLVDADIVGGYSGIRASHHAAIDATDADLLEPDWDGIFAEGSSLVVAERATVTGAPHVGMSIQTGSVFDAPGGSARGGDYGVWCNTGSFCFLNDLQASDNDLDLFAQNSSHIETNDGTGYSTTSPAVGVVGNDQAVVSP